MHHDANLISVLEPDQLTAATTRPLPRRKLGWKTVALLILLRVYIVIAVLIVIYAFIHALRAP